MMERDVGLGMILDSDQSGRVFVEQLLPNSIAQQSGRVLAGDEIVEIQGVQVRGKHAREVKSHIQTVTSQQQIISMRLNRAGQIIDLKLPRSTAGPSMSRDSALFQSGRNATASPHRFRGQESSGSDLDFIDAKVQLIMRNASDDETRQLEENLMQSRRRHAARLQEELARNRSDSADRLQLEVKVLRAEHAGLLEQKLAEIRQEHWRKVEEELDSLRTQSASRLEEVYLRSQNSSASPPSHTRSYTSRKQAYTFFDRGHPQMLFLNLDFPNEITPHVCRFIFTSYCIHTCYLFI